ncbi:hypothetical protein [Streptomyces sp. NPDC020965]|uniref:hypothetical protein n=1 Tax=Streptomyces sp. NPDC020965 TaxID=3365105 RepID=UPI0037931D3F
MSLKTTSRATSRATARLRLTVLVAAPVLVFSAACGGGDDGAGARSHGIAEVSAAAPSSPPAKSDSGTGAARTAGKSAFYDAQLAYVRCMRAKGGYPEFPDPRLSGHLDWAKINVIGSQPGRNEGIKGGKDRACVPELLAASAATPKIDQQKAYESMLAHAKCMRDNGVSRFTNPTMSGGNAVPGGDPTPGTPSIDQRSPAYLGAEKACASKLLEGLDGMQ